MPQTRKLAMQLDDNDFLVVRYYAQQEQHVFHARVLCMLLLYLLNSVRG